MKILEKILERLVICWHVLTKRNYAFFALDNDAIVCIYLQKAGEDWMCGCGRGFVEPYTPACKEFG